MLNKILSFSSLLVMISLVGENAQGLTSPNGFNDGEDRVNSLRVRVEEEDIFQIDQEDDVHIFPQEDQEDERLRNLIWLANEGDVISQYIVGLDYQNGTNTEKNLEEAFKYYKLAAGQGHMDSLYRVGIMYLTGEGADQDLIEGFLYCKLAANKGHIHSLYQVGLLYIQGVGVTEDREKGIEYLKEAAEKGSIPAQDALEELNSY